MARTKKKMRTRTVAILVGIGVAVAGGGLAFAHFTNVGAGSGAAGPAVTIRWWSTRPARRCQWARSGSTAAQWHLRQHPEPWTGLHRLGHRCRELRCGSGTQPGAQPSSARLHGHGLRHRERHRSRHDPDWHDDDGPGRRDRGRQRERCLVGRHLHNSTTSPPTRTPARLTVTITYTAK